LFMYFYLMIIKRFFVYLNLFFIVFSLSVTLGMIMCKGFL